MPELPTGPNLRLQVENLGRIAKADVEIRPLTLFVGENNSGKSYLATAVWAALTGAERSFRAPGDPVWEAALVEAGKVLAELVKAEGAGAKEVAARSFLSGEAAEEDGEVAVVSRRGGWGRLAAAWLAQDLPKAILRALPGLSGVPHVNCSWLLEPDSVALDFTKARTGEQQFFLHIRTGKMGMVLIQEGAAAAAQTALTLATSALTGGGSSRGGVVFLPASRTGYVQLAGAVTDPIMQPRVDGAPSPLAGIPLPTQSFLRFIVRRQLTRSLQSNSRNADLLRLLEEQVIGGRFVQEARPDGTTELRYTPQGSTVQVPIPLTSSLVSELMPLALALTEAPGVLIYEEPEAHLHPRLQRIVAQILVRLVRRGTRVLITTHSTTFVQQINNLLKRGALGEQAPESPEYGPEDVLHPDEVAAYEFQFRSDGLTEVLAADVAADGVALPTFNRALLDLADETVALVERLEERRSS